MNEDYSSKNTPIGTQGESGYEKEGSSELLTPLNKGWLGWTIQWRSCNSGVVLQVGGVIAWSFWGRLQDPDVTYFPLHYYYDNIREYPSPYKYWGMLPSKVTVSWLEALGTNLPEANLERTMGLYLDWIYSIKKRRQFGIIGTGIIFW